MNIIMKTIAAVALSAAVLHGFSTVAFAQQTQEQSLNQNTSQRAEITCESGAYGQPVNCHGFLENIANQSANQTQTNQVVYRIVNGRVVRINRDSLRHEMVDTSVSPFLIQGVAIVSAVTAIIGGFALKRRK